MPTGKMHPVIAKLQGNLDPTAHVQEMLQGTSIIAQAVGVKIQYTVEPADPTVTPDPTIYQAGLRHLHSALAMLGVRSQNVLTDTIKKTRQLPHVPINTPTTAPNNSPKGPAPAVKKAANKSGT